MYESIVKVLNNVKREIIQQYNAKGLRASGSFERGITVARQGRYKVVMTLPYHSQFITKFKGNRPGVKKAPFDKIKQWIKDKGFPLRDYLSGQFMSKSNTNLNKVAFLITRKINKSGTDIYQGKRKPIDLDQITENQFDYNMDEIADRILQDITKDL
jgi:hypothetical protein